MMENKNADMSGCKPCRPMTVKEAIEANNLDAALFADKQRELYIENMKEDFRRYSRKIEQELNEAKFQIKVLTRYMMRDEIERMSIVPK
jgi:hypothetical protein